jgi:hypothetical protein
MSEGDYVNPDCENAIPGGTLVHIVWRETVLEGLSGNIENKWFGKQCLFHDTS